MSAVVSTTGPLSLAFAELGRDLKLTSPASPELERLKANPIEIGDPSIEQKLHTLIGLCHSKNKHLRQEALQVLDRNLNDLCDVSGLTNVDLQEKMFASFMAAYAVITEDHNCYVGVYNTLGAVATRYIEKLPEVVQTRDTEEIDLLCQKLTRLTQIGSPRIFKMVVDGLAAYADNLENAESATAFKLLQGLKVQKEAGPEQCAHLEQTQEKMSVQYAQIAADSRDPRSNAATYRLAESVGVQHLHFCSGRILEAYADKVCSLVPSADQIESQAAINKAIGLLSCGRSEVFTKAINALMPIINRPEHPGYPAVVVEILRLAAAKKSTGSDSELVRVLATVAKDLKHPLCALSTAAIADIAAPRDHSGDHIRRGMISSSIAPALAEILGNFEHPGYASARRGMLLLMKDESCADQVLTALRPILVGVSSMGFAHSAWDYLKQINDPETAYNTNQRKLALSIFAEVVQNKLHPQVSVAYKKVAATSYEDTSQDVLLKVAADSKHPHQKEACKLVSQLFKSGEFDEDNATDLAKIVADKANPISKDISARIAGCFKSAPSAQLAALSAIEILKDPQHRYYKPVKQAVFKLIDDGDYSNNIRAAMSGILVSIAQRTMHPERELFFKKFQAQLNSYPDIANIVAIHGAVMIEKLANNFIDGSASNRVESAAKQLAKQNVYEMFSGLNAPFGVNEVVKRTLLNAVYLHLSPVLLDARHPEHNQLCGVVQKQYYPAASVNGETGRDLFSQIVLRPSHHLFRVALDQLKIWSQSEAIEDGGALKNEAAVAAKAGIDHLITEFPQLNSGQQKVALFALEEFIGGSCDRLPLARAAFDCALSLVEGLSASGRMIEDDLAHSAFKLISGVAVREANWNSFSADEQDRIIRLLNVKS